MSLAGLTVPVPTLFGEDGSLDRSRNARFARELAEAKVDHLFVLGTLGEFTVVEPAERRPLLESIIETLPPSTDAWVGCGAPSTARAVRFAQEAEEAGASVLLAVPPYYLEPTESSIARYYRAIRAAVEIPLLAYNIPAKVGYPLSARVVHQLAEERVIDGMKDTSGSLESVERFLAGAPAGFKLLPGDDALTREAMARGAVGSIMGTANILPRLCRELVEACRSGESARAGELQAHVDALARVVGRGPFPSTTKFLAHHLRGADVGYRPPYEALSESEQAVVLEAWAEVDERLHPYLPP